MDDWMCVYMPHNLFKYWTDSREIYYKYSLRWTLSTIGIFLNDRSGHFVRASILNDHKNKIFICQYKISMNCRRLIAVEKSAFLIERSFGAQFLIASGEPIVLIIFVSCQS